LTSEVLIRVEFHHVPVMLTEVLEALAVRPEGTYVDCTAGGGGHSEAIARRLGPAGLLIALDQDPAALAAAGVRLQPYADRVRLVRRNFRDLAAALAELDVPAADGILFDLGVSSYQFDEAERGFSYQHDAPLDMRMDPDADLTARDLLNELDAGELTRILREYGEERFANRIARLVVQERSKHPIGTTGDLVEIIKRAIPAPARRTGGHPARRSFQALRIAVNDEMGALREGLEAALSALAPGGRLAILTFHSLEDRIVKRTLAAAARGCTCSPHAPACICGKQPDVRLVGRQPAVPGPAEVEANPRARSAKLRVAEKLGPAF